MVASIWKLKSEGRCVSEIFVLFNRSKTSRYRVLSRGDTCVTNSRTERPHFTRKRDDGVRRKESTQKLTVREILNKLGLSVKKIEFVDELKKQVVQRKIHPELKPEHRL